MWDQNNQDLQDLSERRAAAPTGADNAAQPNSPLQPAAETYDVPTRDAMLRPGKIVRADGTVLRIPSYGLKRLTAQLGITYGLIRAAFERVELPAMKRLCTAEVNFRRVIGGASLVPAEAVTPGDVVHFAYRRHQSFPSRVALGVPKPLTSILTLALRREASFDSKAWTLESVHFGSALPLQPLKGRVVKGDPALQARVMAFWCCHALVYEPGEYATPPFASSWARLCARRIALGSDGFPENGPYWTGDA